MKLINHLREARPDSRQSIERASFVFMDIETTGLRADRGARITEIAILSRSEPVFLWQQEKDDINDQNQAAKFPELIECLTTGVVVGHNLKFDLQFIAYEAERLGVKGPDIYYIDTLQLAQKVYDSKHGYKLSSLLKAFEITVNGELHTASVDVQATRALFWKLVNHGDIATLSDAGMQRLSWGTF